MGYSIFFQKKFLKPFSAPYYILDLHSLKSKIVSNQQFAKELLKPNMGKFEK